MEIDLVIAIIVFTILISVSLGFCIWSLVLIYQNQSSIQSIKESIDILEKVSSYNALDIPLINRTNLNQVATISVMFQRKQGKTEFYLNAVEDFTLIGTAEWFEFILPDLPIEFLSDSQLTFSFPSKNDATFSPSGIFIPIGIAAEKKFIIFPLATLGITMNGEPLSSNTVFTGICGWNKSVFSY